MRKTAFLSSRIRNFAKLENPKLGTEFEINDHRGVVVGIAKVTTGGLFGIPTLYTTYKRAIQYIPTSRYTISYVLVEPKSNDAIPHIKSKSNGSGMRR